ncbi:MAG: (E)-4-hydroxy-3-methylbut-2-enyl-diphosphate synthase [Muribaculaceae bacterium]|nr:(E)-4-hydroxy-3-methylbut-2-enyl-diphosphate synthase [Muribaculaceae bacterium]
MNNIFNYRRRATVDVNVGGVMLGSSHEVRVQSMTNTNTDDIEASVAQSQRIADAGGDIVRLTAQGVKEAENIGRIRTVLREHGCDVPLVADIHFNPKAAFAAAAVTDKVRINPGNFVDPARQFKSLSYTDEEYQAELQRIHDALVPFIDICREHHTAVRLGVNHGSLSDRIMSRYGNTAAGMVESVMEFLRVFVEQKFFDVVISMKASNVVVMVEAVRRVVAAMDAEDMHFPLHLGVTEAGFGEDGRIKSAVGIGCLMSEGLGDTIRVSLSEDPEVEVPVAQKLVQYITGRAGHDVIEGEVYEGYDALTPQRRRSLTVLDKIGGRKVPVVVASCAPEDIAGKLKPDYYFADGALTDGTKTYPLVSLADFVHDAAASVQFVQVAADASKEQLQMLKGLENVVVIATAANMNVTGSLQAMLHTMVSLGVDCPVVVRVNYADTDTEWLQVKAGADLGTLLLNGFADGIWLEAPHYDSQQKVVEYAFAILQAARLRTSKTEFISCPSCGRTMFDLQTTVQQVKAATSHLTHLKIGVMGCVVNGPGEMADADYGYVGAARHSISLYKGKECIERNVPETEAIPRLVALIKANGDWVEP